MGNRTIVMLAGKGESSNIVYHAIDECLPIQRVIFETPEPRWQFLTRRIKRFGPVRVLGQVLFQLVVVPCLKHGSKERVSEIKRDFKLDDRPVPVSKVARVDSVNSDDTAAILRALNPDVVIVNGTRILSGKIIHSVGAKFINMHAGITPLYRGVHGAYWALVENRKEACGVTVHLVDEGIDTGNILEQAVIGPTDEDNFYTYPLLQLAAGIPLLKKAIQNILEDRIEIKSYPEGKSRLWSHPNLWEYLWNRVCYGIK